MVHADPKDALVIAEPKPKSEIAHAPNISVVACFQKPHRAVATLAQGLTSKRQAVAAAVLVANNVCLEQDCPCF